MRNRFDIELDKLNNMLIEMGLMIENAIEDAISALINKDPSLASQVISQDSEIDHIEKEIESKCMSLLLKQHPVASDLRLISSALKMITDMERIGDQATDIAEIALRISNDEYSIPMEDISKMAKTTIAMVKYSVEAFTTGDLSLADKVILKDDEVDKLFDIVKNELIDLIHKNPNLGEQAIDFLMVAKYFERIGDHAENIAEWVVYSITGKNPSSNI